VTAAIVVVVVVVVVVVAVVVVVVDTVPIVRPDAGLGHGTNSLVDSIQWGA
jgi:hypothetical protein